MPTETIIELNDTQRIQILEKTKEILGPNGENWTKACWFGVKFTEDEITERLEEFGYDPGEVSDAEFKQINEDEEYELSRYSLAPDRAGEANVWCLMGAIEEAAYRLGIVPERDSSERFASPISLSNLVQSRAEWAGWSVVDVNDKPDTTFETVRNLIDERLAELRA